ncbi:hypothetical protein PS15m_003076 [Mucor circinelloides]
MEDHLSRSFDEARKNQDDSNSLLITADGVQYTAVSLPDNHSGSVDEVNESQSDRTNLSITIDGVQYAAVSSSDDPSPEPTIDRSAGTHAAEKAFLLEISANKEWMAYVVEKTELDQDRQFYLRIRNITYSSIGAIQSQGSLEIDITDCMKCLDALTYCFLSISPNGERVAISFCKFDPEGNLTSKRPTCWTFRVVGSQVKLDEEIKCQGKAVFTPDDHLAIVGKHILNLYSCKEGYKFVNCLDIRHLFPAHEQMQEDIHPRATQIFWNSSFNGPLKFQDIDTDQMLSPVQAILYLTRFIKYNLLTPCYHMLATSGIDGTYDGASIWSLADGVKSLPLNLTEEVLAISSDKTLAATFGDESTYLNVYHIKTGLLVSKLESQRNIKARILYPLEYWWPRVLYRVHFSKDNEYIFLITIYGNIKSLNQALFMIEVWSRNAEKLVFEFETKIERDWDSKNNLVPYIIESADSPPTFTAVYTTFSENGTLIFKSENLDVFKDVGVSNMEMIRGYSMQPVDSFMQHVCDLRLTAELDNIMYQLCFGKFAVELWRLKESNGEIQREMIYIRAFKSPRYHRRRGFMEKWILKSYDESRAVIQSPDRLPSLGIRIGERGRIVVRIRYVGIKYQNSALLHQDEIYLPLAELRLAEEALNLAEEGKQNSFELACADFHYVESVCRALHFFYKELKKIEDDLRFMKVDEELIERYTERMKQTKRLAEQSIKQMKKEKSRYFTTISGSNTLAMLASFQDGRDIIFQILQTDDLPINIIGYVRVDALTEKKGESVDRNENALTILIEQFDYELFDLLFNRVLLYSANLGIGAFCAITETLVFLQGRGETVVFQNCCKKLKFLAMKSDFGKLGKNQWDIRMVMSVDILHKSTSAEFSDFSSHTTQEQISKFNFIWGLRAKHILWRCAKDIKATVHQALVGYRFYRRLYFRNYYNGSADDRLLSVCAVPFIHFSSYTIFWEDVEFKAGHSNRDDQTWTARLKLIFCKLLHLSYTQDRAVHKAESDLMQLASKQHENDLFHQKGSVVEVLLYYKWKTFIRKRFYLICFIHLMYYLSFCVGVLFARECFDYTIGNSISNPQHIAPIALMFVANLILSGQELLQFFKMGLLRYFESFYNIVDLAALIMPPVSFWLMISGNSTLDEVSAVTTIILWMHAILRLRPFASIVRL